MIKAIFFDCFGVLTTDRWLLFLDSLPDSVPIDEVRQVHRAFDAGIISEKACAQQIFELTGQRFEETPDTMAGITKNIPLLDYIASLKPTYKIGMISNIADNWVKDVFLTAKEQSLFDDMVFSFEVGITKPEPAIYQTALDRLGVKANESVFIDDIERFASAAAELGMKGIWYRNFQQLKQDLGSLLANPNH